ncbi:hypothetical protein A1O1_00843 [Capronia coronata CBS 617.96]|uniref:Uncharacterized protein n=1 Tax=Capronia coronata CBS 617.96 TaxID=1182541 RepID=W9ZMI6_9EURO|nr:uncharacterized protein A1O1_00843 [Capronia coronata CBS 617.96]EXJ95719.1 hypothetical protein A1O1_00843 [Capronia coronata CBS 617.96]
MQLGIILVVTFTLASRALCADCPCGWRLEKGHGSTIVSTYAYTHRLHEDFSQYPDIKSILTDPEAANFNNDWMIYDY